MKTLVPLLVCLVLLQGDAAAQPATWIAPGPYVATSFDPVLGYWPYVYAPPGRWSDPANWSTGTVPNAADAVAVVRLHPIGLYGLVPPVSDYPGAAGAIIDSGAVTLAGLQFQSSGSSTALISSVTIGTDSNPASLTLAGPGITWTKTEPGGAGAPIVNVTNGLLEFRNQASTMVYLTATANGQIAFRDQASALTGTGLVAGGQLRAYGGRIDFYDRSSAGTGRLVSAMIDDITGQVEFHQESTADRARLDTMGNGHFVFSDNSSAGTATIRPEIDPAYSIGRYPAATVIFRDTSTADHAAIEAAALDFRDSASAASATIYNPGYSMPAGHGYYAGYNGRVTFMDDSTAGQAVILNGGGNNYPGLGELVFLDRSTAGSALITSYGNIGFAGHATLANARIIANSLTYPKIRGYGQAPQDVTTGRITFRDQASGGSGRIEIASSAVIIDFSGLYSGNGTTGRAPLAAPATGPAIVPDDTLLFSLGALTNTAPGGTIYLGGTRLAVGTGDMTLNALIRDVGGSYGSLAGEPLRGGGLTMNGSGTLTISNPDNDYAGRTAILHGTVNLAGGSIANADLQFDGRLTGSGTVRGTLANGIPTHLGSGTTVSPGNSIGTITVTGDYLQYAGGTLNMEIASATSSDRLIVNGRASLDGQLNVSLLNGYVPVGDDTLPLISATKISGLFKTVTLPTGLGAALTASIVTAPSGISLQVTQQSFAGFAGGSPAAAALGAHLDATLVASAGDYRSLIASLNTLPTASNLATALAALAPDRYSALAENGFATAASRQAALDRRLAAGRGPGPARGFDAFFETSYRRSCFDASDSLPAASSQSSGGSAGASWHNNAFLLGAVITQESGALDLDNLGSRADLKSLTPALLFQYSPDGYFLQATAAYSRDDYDLRRRIVCPGTGLTAQASPGGQRNNLAFTAGHVFPAGAWTFTPSLGVRHSTFSLDLFTETGAGEAGLMVSDFSVRSTRALAGMETIYRSPDGNFTPSLALVWLHELQGNRDFRAGFVGAGAGYTVPGRAAERNLVQASFSLEKRLGRAATVTATLGALWGGNSRTTTDLSAGFRWEF